MSIIAFIDAEVDPRNGKVLDIGGIRSDGPRFHGSSMTDFAGFLRGAEYVCGHNILNHDLKYLMNALDEAGIARDKAIDTLYLSPLLFPKKPYHKLLKDDKLQVDELNNPQNDSIKACDLFNDEAAAFARLDDSLKTIYWSLLKATDEFMAFFRYTGYSGEVPLQNNPQPVIKGLLSMFRRDIPRYSRETEAVCNLVRNCFRDTICANADLERMMTEQPVALAYCLALITAMESDKAVRSVTPSWVLHNYPQVEQMMFRLRNTPCPDGCPYCDRSLDIHSALYRWFGFSSFRSYGGEPLQEKAVRTAVESQSLLAVFPTGGGKSLAFQLPALIAGENTGALTVVISPLQSLMKDQVDNLEKKGITESATINGLLDPIERAKAFERVENGTVSILYVSPESLRSRSIEKLILHRKIARFVIDEAHCFSSWGQDFRVDYLYIADFIKMIQEKKNLQWNIPVSCFTATAKPQVIEDISRYFKDRLFLDLKLFTATVTRPNLHYTVLPEKDDEAKYQALRRLLEERICPAIVYVTRTRKAEDLAGRLEKDGFSARPYHGKMEPDIKIRNQNAFMAGEVRIIVATSAFGMGVDKSDVGLVVHYQISDSLENYVQEAGRAGRDENIEADCYVLFNEEDLSKHFILLNQTKITVKEIQQVWQAVKGLSKYRSSFSASALEIARLAGWDDGVSDIETRVRTAIASLEQAGYLRRGQNMPRVYATGILVRTAQEAIDRISASARLDDDGKRRAVRIIRSLISSRSRQRADEAESRVDYLADRLGIPKEDIIHTINILREEKILADSKDITAYIYKGDTENKSRRILKAFNEVEDFLYPYLDEAGTVLDLKELNEQAVEKGLGNVNVKRIMTLLNFWAVKGWIHKKRLSASRNQVPVQCIVQKDSLPERIGKRQALSLFIIDYLYENAKSSVSGNDEISVEFSELAVKEAYENSLSSFSETVSSIDVEDALFYLSRIGALKVEGGFLVIYNSMKLERLEKDNKKKYRLEEYENLGKFYENRIQQIHIVGEYAKKMIEDYKGALQFVEDYFQMGYQFFLEKYFRSRRSEISQNITPAKFRQIFGELSPAQLKIIKDNRSKVIVVAAGPGSGKTRVLAHKLASLLLMEDVKHDQLLMLTFSRAAATEFKQRLYALIGNAAAFVEIKTFHSYCFDLLGMIGSIDRSEKIVSQAVEKIEAREVDIGRITKTVLVIDEAQDMDEDEYSLVKALMALNEDMRVIAVGDDDQNIYSFRGSDSRYMEDLLNTEGAKKYDLVENFRSARNLVEFSNLYAATISHRLKSYDIVPVRQEPGRLKLIRYAGRNLAVPVSESVMEFLMNGNFSGSVAVLTRTNDEALEILDLLLKQKVPARLIQSNVGFNLSSLAEIRYFMDRLHIRDEGAVISDDDWESAKSDFYSVFSRSDKQEICHNLINTFESTDRKIKYKTDFETFVKESHLEDFVRSDTASVTVSTMHKVKGKEFDTVFLVLDRFQQKDDKDRRLLYVALTRAKDNLSIHMNSSLLDGFTVEGIERYNNTRQYSPSEERTLLLSLSDIWLSDSGTRQRAISDLRSGDLLYADETECRNAKGQTVLKFSNVFKKKLAAFISNGYSVVEAKVNFIVWWKGEDMDKEIRIVLPVLHIAGKI